MQFLLFGFIFHLLIVISANDAGAGVAEASTAVEHQLSTRYDLAGLSDRERDWFLTFIKGNFLAEGWGRITSDILAKTAADERADREQELNQLGTKIGREWCKDNDVRRINNAMLRDWGSKLREAAKDEPQRLAEVIRYIDREVSSAID